jgi:predicted TIM-barrel fold metal-dependent hydrolase
MTYIDAHNHPGDTDGETRAYIDAYDKHGIEKGVFAGTSYDRDCSNADVEKCMKAYPGRVFGFAYIDPDRGKVEDIDRYLDRGFSGLKIITTQKPYHHPSYLPFYEHMQALKKPVLFHTGYLGGKETIDINHYRPVYLDAIARHFPDLKMICAHLGNPWWEEAYLVICKRKNVYCDFSGMTLRRRPLSLLEGLFHKDGAFDTEAFGKVLFATDMEVAEMKAYHDSVFEKFNVAADLRERVAGKTFLSLL